MWQHSPRYTIVVYMQIVVPRSPVESFKLWLEQFSFMKEGCDIFFEPLEKVVRVSANYAYSSQKKIRSFDAFNSNLKISYLK